MSLLSTIDVFTSDSSSDSDESVSSQSSTSTSSDDSPRNSPKVLRASCSRNLELQVFLGKPDSTSTTAVRGNKENMEVVILKVVPVVTKTRSFEGSRFWVAVAVGDHKSLIGIGEHVAKNEAIATRKAQKKAFRNVRKVELFEGRTVKGKVTGFSGGACATIAEAPRGVGIVTTSGMARRLLQLAGMKDCFVKNVWDKLSTVRALNKALSKLK